MIRIASCQYQIEALPDWTSYAQKIEKIVLDAKNKGANILVLPEYVGIEAACQKLITDEELFIALQYNIPSFRNLYKKLAQNYQIYIQAGTIVEEIVHGKFVNRAYLFSPNGLCGYQDKLQLTESEKNKNIFQHGIQRKIFETSLGNIAIVVCYDSEFPEIVRSLVQAGAEIILVPSYTTSIAGYNRVFLTCRARAIENQCYTAISYTINKVDLTTEVDETYGQAAILGPADIGFPDDGIIANGVMNKPMLVVADISLEALVKVRKFGQVLNFKDTVNCTTLLNNKIETLAFL